MLSGSRGRLLIDEKKSLEEILTFLFYSTLNTFQYLLLNCNIFNIKEQSGFRITMQTFAKRKFSLKNLNLILKFSDSYFKLKD